MQSVDLAKITATDIHPTLQSTAMKPRWIDWLAAAAIAFTLSAGAAATAVDDLPRAAQGR